MEQVAQAEAKLSLKIQQEYSQVCMQVGDLMHKLEELKKIQLDLSQKYISALNEEKASEPTS